MLEQDNNFYLIIFSILIICLLDNVGYYREKLHVNHFRQYKSQRVNVHVSLHLTGSARVFGYSVFRGVLNRVYGILQLKYGYSVYHFL